MELRTEHIRVSIDRATHARLKRVSENTGRPMAALLRESIQKTIDADERARALLPPRLEPWRSI